MLTSASLFSRAKKIIPGGVNSPVRAFKNVDGEPIFFKAGLGAYLIDIEDKKFIDYVGSWGPLILGHCHPKVLAAVKEVLTQGMSFGAPTFLEVQLAEKINQCMPQLEQIRMVNSGTEATMTAIRLARGFTGKDKIIKFEGCYHGHHDGLLVKAGSGLLSTSIPTSAGIPKAQRQDTLVASYNRLEEVESLLKQEAGQVAAIIVEPVAGNMNFILPEPEFLQGLRKLCDQHEALLIFDEVMTGFRVGLNGAQGHYQIKADLTTLGKIIGGGMPVGALGGSKTIMSHLSPEGAVYQAGTLSGNPLAMAAGLSTLTELESPNFYEALSSKTENLVMGLSDLASRYGLPFYAASLGGMFGFAFTSKKMKNLQDAQQANQVLFKQFFHQMLEEGIYFAPSAYEAGFLSIAHQAEELELTLDAANRVMSKLKVS